MKIKICLAGMFLSLAFNTYSQTFQKDYGGTGLEFCWTLRGTFDKNFMFVGNTNSFGPGNIYVVKIDADGDTMWTKVLGGGQGEYGLNAHQANDGGMMVIGKTYSFGAGDADAFIIKLDTGEQVMWSKTYGGLINDEFLDIIPVGGNGFLLMGTSSSFGGGTSFDTYMVKINAWGDTIWTKTIVAPGYDAPLDIKETSDNGYIITGYTNSFGVGQDDIFLIKTDSNANIQWSKVYGGVNSDAGSSVIQTPDDGYIVVGETHSFGPSYGSVFMMKTDALGNPVWSKRCGDPYLVWAYEIIQTQDDQYVVTGQGQITGSGGHHAFLLKMDVGGGIIWSHLYGGNELDNSRAVVEMVDHGFMLGGLSNEVGAGGWDYYAVRTDSLGFSPCNMVTVSISDSNVVPTVSNAPFTLNNTTTIISNPTPFSSHGGMITTLCSTVGVDEILEEDFWQVYPNPTSGVLNIPVEIESAISVFDINGRRVLSTHIHPGEFVLLDQLANGMYCVQIRNEQGISTNRVILNK